MNISLTHTELRARALTDLRMGVPVVIGEHIVAASETLTDERLNDLRKIGKDVYLAITSWRAQTLKIAAYDGVLARIILPADQSSKWVRAMADPARDLDMPLKGPFQMMRGGPVDAAFLGISLCKDAHLLPAVVVGSLRDKNAASQLVHLPADLSTSTHMHPVSAANVPMQAAQAGRVHIYRPNDGAEEHYAIQIGDIERDQPILTRLHSACFTGDVLGSLKCDCGPQLNAALTQMGQAGQGVLLYLNQEGRGIGLANKMRAYALQDQGFDTVEANHRLGFEDDERDFRIGAQLLQSLGITQVRLLTNNPAKVQRLCAMGIDVVERVPLKVGIGDHNRAYLATKAAKSGHLL